MTDSSTILFGDKPCWRCKQALPDFPAKLRTFKVTYQQLSGDRTTGNRMHGPFLEIWSHLSWCVS